MEEALSGWLGGKGGIADRDPATVTPAGNHGAL